MRVLVIAPHGDDEIIGCGGKILWHLDNGDEVFVIYVTFGDALRSEYTQAELTAKRREEIISAAKVLGLKEENLSFMPEIYHDAFGLSYPPAISDGGGYYPLRLNEMQLVNNLIDLIREATPEVIYLSHEGEFHLDHQIVARMGKQAIRFASGPWFRNTGSVYEKFQIREVWGYEVDEPIVKPDMVAPISSKGWIKKLDALKCHATTQDVPFFEKRIRNRQAHLRETKTAHISLETPNHPVLLDPIWGFEAFEKITIWRQY